MAVTPMTPLLKSFSLLIASNLSAQTDAKAKAEKLSGN